MKQVVTNIIDKFLSKFLRKKTMSEKDFKKITGYPTKPDLSLQEISTLDYLEGKNFIEKCIDGSASVLEVDDYIDKWHESKSKKSLHDFLGMTWIEYQYFLTDPDFLLTLVESRKYEKYGE